MNVHKRVKSGVNVITQNVRVQVKTSFRLKSSLEKWTENKDYS